MLADWLLIKTRGVYPGTLTVQWWLVEFFKILPRTERREMFSTPGLPPASTETDRFSIISHYANFQHLHRKLLWSATIVSAVGWTDLCHNTTNITTPCLTVSVGDKSLLVFWTRPVTNKPFGPIVTLSQGSICPGKMRVSLWGFHRN